MSQSDLSTHRLILRGHSLLPIVQGGMGVGISRSRLAGSVAGCGGIGIISTAQIGYDEPGFDNDPKSCNRKAIEKHIKKAKEICAALVTIQNMF